MFSLGKIFWLAVILWGVWTAFRMFENRQKRGKPPAGSQQSHADQNTASQNGNNADSASVDMQECSSCKSWVGRDGCNQPDCPVKQS